MSQRVPYCRATRLTNKAREPDSLSAFTLFLRAVKSPQPHSCLPRVSFLRRTLRGLASAVVAPGELDAAVQRTVDALLAVNRDASAETKALLQAAARRTQPEQEAAEREAQYRRLRALAGLDAES